MALMNRGSPTPYSLANIATSAPTTPPAPSGTPKFADWEQYDPYWYRSNYGASQAGMTADQSKNPFQFSGGQQNYGEQGSSEGQGGHWEMTGGENANTVWVPDPVTMKINDAAIPQKYQGLYTGMTGGGTGQEQFTYNQDKLNAMPKVGNTGLDRTNFMSLGANKQAGPDWSQIKGSVRDPYNKNAVIWDDNYGWLTPTKNLYSKADQKDQRLMSMIQAGVGLGFGAFMPGMIPGIMRSVIGGAQSLGDGANWKNVAMNVAPGLIGAGMSGAGFNLPPGLSQALRYGQMGYGAYNAIRSRDPFQMARLATSFIPKG